MSAVFTDLFNPGGLKEEKAKDSEVYTVSYKKGKDNVYKSVIRFLPWYQDTNNNVMSKYITYLKNPINATMARYIDNPENDSPLSQMYFRLVNTKIAKFEDFAKSVFASKRQYAALVQILSDEQQPELVGKIKVFKFGKSIMDKLKAEENPVMGNPINPFHPIYGRKFALVVTEKKNFNNYDQSQFFTEQNGGTIMPSGMWYYNPATQQTEIVTEHTDVNVLREYLANNCPDLSKYAVQPWSESDQKFVSEVLQICENYIASGGNLSTEQTVTQQSFAALNNSPVGAPVFPGAGSTPSFPGSVPPQATTPAPSAMPQFTGAPQPMGVPAQAPQPMGQVPPAPQQMGVPSQAPQPMVMGVEIPNVAPTGAPSGGAMPNRGMNVDDILGQL